MKHTLAEVAWKAALIAAERDYWRGVAAFYHDEAQNEAANWGHAQLNRLEQAWDRREKVLESQLRIAEQQIRELVMK